MCRFKDSLFSELAISKPNAKLIQINSKTQT